MSDHRERPCTRCGSLLHHEDDGRCEARHYIAELKAAHEQTVEFVARLATAEAAARCRAAERDAAQAALERAVAALKTAVDEDRIQCDCGAAKVDGLPCTCVAGEMDRILADPTSAQAGEAHAEVEALVEAVRRWYRYGGNEKAMFDALAAIDARRGGDKGECAGCAKVARHPGEKYVCVLHPRGGQ